MDQRPKETLDSIKVDQTFNLFFLSSTFEKLFESVSIASSVRAQFTVLKMPSIQTTPPTGKVGRRQLVLTVSLDHLPSVCGGLAAASFP